MEKHSHEGDFQNFQPGNQKSRGCTLRIASVKANPNERELFYLQQRLSMVSRLSRVLRLSRVSRLSRVLRLSRVSRLSRLSVSSLLLLQYT